jgi:ABC-type polysaccharide/polyol phosphate transport system ATPase subunit
VRAGAPVVEVTGISMAYRIARNRATTFQEYAFRLLKRQIEYEELWALRDVSLELHAGQVLGVIGPNGAGKSTLMKVVARVLPPNDGRVIVRGVVAPMIELGAGFHPDLTGFENIVLCGTILGRDARTMRGRAPEIAEWAGLQDFLDAPIRGYSSGMVARLAFAVTTDAVPDVLLVDEVLAVGDADFQERSRQRIEGMIARGTAIMLVSHDLDTIREAADEVMWLDHGRVSERGDPDHVVDAYVADSHTKALAGGAVSG